MRIWYTATFDILTEIDTDSLVIDADVKRELLVRVKREGILVAEKIRVATEGKDQYVLFERRKGKP